MNARLMLLTFKDLELHFELGISFFFFLDQELGERIKIVLNV